MLIAALRVDVPGHSVSPGTPNPEYSQEYYYWDSWCHHSDALGHLSGMASDGSERSLGLVVKWAGS